MDGAKSVPEEKIVDSVNQLYELSKSELIPPTDVPSFVKEKIEEKRRLEEEIRKSCAILDQEKIDFQTIEEFRNLKEVLNKRGVSIGDPRRFTSVLQTIDRIGNDPRKIVKELAPIKSLKWEERRLKNGCKQWESRAARFRQVLPSCEQIVRFGIGIKELIAFHTAVIMRADMDGITTGAAAYRILKNIDNYNKLDGMQKQLNDTIINLQMVNLVAAHHNIAANTVMRLLSLA